MPPVRDLVLRLVRSGIAGAGATLADLAVLGVLVSALGLSPRVASVPALLAGNVVMFVGQKLVAFRARGTDVRRELVLFAIVQAGGFVLNALAYDLAMRVVPDRWYVAARLATSNVVWLAYSFPLWHFVFRSRSPRRSGASLPGAARPPAGG